MNSKTYIKVTKIIFGVVALVHLLRLIMGWTLVINGYEVPAIGSVIGAIVAGYLAYSGYKLVGKK